MYIFVFFQIFDQVCHPTKLKDTKILNTAFQLLYTKQRVYKKRDIRECNDQIIDDNLDFIFHSVNNKHKGG